MTQEIVACTFYEDCGNSQMPKQKQTTRQSPIQERCTGDTEMKFFNRKDPEAEAYLEFAEYIDRALYVAGFHR